MVNDDTRIGPYGRAARMYRAAGWQGVLPLGRAPGEKWPPPGNRARGVTWTGHGAPYPHATDIEAWIETHADRNIGLRLPAGVIGLDVDAYAGKRGGETLVDLVAKFGPLPPTWVTSARTDGVSGIRLFRVPELLDGKPINWPGEAGKHIEIIQTGHRYAVVWPSTNPEAGGAVYQWGFEQPGGSRKFYGGGIPDPAELPELPERWVRGLALPYDRTEKAELGTPAMAAWWADLRGGEPCPVIHSVWTRAVDNLRNDAGSRHETARDSLRAVVAAGAAGHRGTPAAVKQLRDAFAEAVGEGRMASGEWDRLVSGAVKLAATDNPEPQQHCEHDAATAIEAPPGFTMPAPAAASTPTFAQGSLTLPDEFWAARESLSRIRQAAHSRVRSGDVVFYGMLCRLAAMAPHTLRADTGIGSPASLNLFSAVVGPSGGGKSSGLAVSRELLKATRDLDEFALGSGEGIAEAFMGEATEPTGEMAKDGSEKTVKVRKMVRHNVLFHTDEGNSLNKLIERSGSTVGETLRSAWSGETIGQKNGRVETTRTVPARSYSLGAVIGYQPSTVLPLLNDYEAGTPQRFLFCWAVDPSIPSRQERVPWPGEMESPFPAHVQTDIPAPGPVFPAPAQHDLVRLTFASSILDELYEIEHAKNTGSLPPGHPLLDPFRSQHPVLKVKVSALLALLESRRNVTEDDWRIAQLVIDTSDKVRESLQVLAARAAGKARAALLAAEAEAEHHRAHARASVAAALDSTAETRVAIRLAQKVHDLGPMTLGGLRKQLAGRDKHLTEVAADAAIAHGWLATDADKFIPGTSRPV